MGEVECGFALTVVGDEDEVVVSDVDDSAERGSESEERDDGEE